MKTEATRKEFSACELWKRSENSYAIGQRMELSKIKWEKEESKNKKDAKNTLYKMKVGW